MDNAFFKPLKQYTLFKKDYPFRSNTFICISDKNTPDPQLFNENHCRKPEIIL